VPDDAIRYEVTVSQHDDRLSAQPEVELHYRMAVVPGDARPREAGGAGGAGSLSLLARGPERGRDHVRGRIAVHREPRAGGAAAHAARLHLPEIRRAHHSTAIATCRPMGGARILAADWARAHAGERERSIIDVAELAVLLAGIGAVGVGQLCEVDGAMSLPVCDAFRGVVGADMLAARRARRDLIRREQRRCFVGAGACVLPAYQPPRRLGTAQMTRAMDLPINGAYGLMGSTDRLAAARALRHLIHAHRLIAAPLALPHTRRAEPAAAFRRVGTCLLGVLVADDAAAARARLDAQRARRVITFATDPLVGRAVLKLARGARPHVLRTRRFTVHPTLSDAVLDAEVRSAD
jgi:hypothetical protein